MSSINLLPNGPIVQKKEIRKETKSASFISFCLVIVSIASLAFLYLDNQRKTEEVASLEVQSSTIDVEINKEIAKNKLLSTDNEEDKIAFLLSKHSYLTKAIYFIQDNLVKDAYINDVEIAFGKENTVNIKINGVARNYANIATQLYVLKNSPVTRSFNIKSISENDLGNVVFEGDLDIDVKAVLYNDGTNNTSGDSAIKEK